LTVAGTAVGTVAVSVAGTAGDTAAGTAPITNLIDFQILSQICFLPSPFYILV